MKSMAAYYLQYRKQNYLLSLSKHSLFHYGATNRPLGTNVGLGGTVRRMHLSRCGKFPDGSSQIQALVKIEWKISLLPGSRGSLGVLLYQSSFNFVRRDAKKPANQTVGHISKINYILAAAVFYNRHIRFHHAWKGLLGRRTTFNSVDKFSIRMF